MEKKQSSIEQVFSHIKASRNDVQYWNDSMLVDWLLEQEDRLKAMHKEEIEDAWLNGMKGEMIAPFGMNRYKPEAEEYYNETFGGTTGVIGVDNISWTNTNKLNNGGNNE